MIWLRSRSFRAVFCRCISVVFRELFWVDISQLKFVCHTMYTSNYIVKCCFGFFSHLANTKSADVIATTWAVQNVVEIAETYGAAVFVDFIFLFWKVIHKFYLVFWDRCFDTHFVARSDLLQVYHLVVATVLVIPDLLRQIVLGMLGLKISTLGVKKGLLRSSCWCWQLRCSLDLWYRGAKAVSTIDWDETYIGSGYVVGGWFDRALLTGDRLLLERNHWLIGGRHKNPRPRLVLA